MKPYCILCSKFVDKMCDISEPDTYLNCNGDKIPVVVCENMPNDTIASIDAAKVKTPVFLKYALGSLPKEKE